MIGRIYGILISIDPSRIIIDCAGVGYEVHAPINTICKLPSIGEYVTLLTHLVIRNDTYQLYGFITENEKFIFKQLIKVNGIGMKMAISILSTLNVQDIYQAISLQDSTILKKIPGIGSKTAERILLELRDKLVLNSNLNTIRENKFSNEINQALSFLGYSEKEINKATQNIKDCKDISDGIRQALKILTIN